MRILLIQAVSTIEGGELVYPLGLARLGARLGQDHHVRGLDLNLHYFPWNRLVEVLQDFQPQVVGISFRNIDPLAGILQSFVPHLKALSALLRLHAPQVVQIIGGAGFSLFSRRIMNEVPGLDFGIVGEAEAILPVLLDHLKAPQMIPGVLWRTSNQVAGFGRGHFSGFNHTLLPDWNLFPPKDYTRRNQYVAFMGVETKRGCPHSCRYCIYPLLQGRRPRLREPADVLDEMELLHRQYGMTLFHFTDPVLNQPASHLHNICCEILQRKLPLEWTGFFREDSLTAEDLSLYKKAGLIAIYFSADGASEIALEILRKNLTSSQILNAAELAAGSGLTAVYHFLVNLPGENKSSVIESQTLFETISNLHLAQNNPPTFVFNNLRLYPGSPLTEDMLNRSLVDPKVDLLYPTYFNPPPWDGLRHELTARYMCSQVEKNTDERNEDG